MAKTFVYRTWGLGIAPPQFAMASLEFFRALPDRCGAGIVAALNRLPRWTGLEIAPQGRRCRRWER
jgi:hypothetical protein